MKLKYFLFFSLLFNTFVCVPADAGALIEAIENDNDDFIENEVDNNGLDINRTLQVNTPNLIVSFPLISYAIFANAKKIIYLLIEKEVNLNKKGSIERDYGYSTKEYSPLKLALHFNNVSFDVIERLIQFGAKYEDDGSLLKALEDINDQKKKWLLKYIFQNITQDLIYEAIDLNNSDILKLLAINGLKIPKDALEYAKKLNKKNVIEYLQYYSDLNVTIEENTKLPKDVINIIHDYSQGSGLMDTNKLLLEAIYEKNIEYIEYYLANSGNPDYSFIPKIGVAPKTLLYLAIFFTAEDIAKLLIKNNADINLACMKGDNLYSPLLAAFTNKNITIDFIIFLMENGADIEHIQFKKNSKKIYNIAYLLTKENVSLEKKFFIKKFLIQKFGENVLDFVLNNPDISVEIINLFSQHAKVDKYLIEKAKKLKHPKKIINHLNLILNFVEQS